MVSRLRTTAVGAICYGINYILELGLNRVEMKTALDPELIGEVAKL